MTNRFLVRNASVVVLTVAALGLVQWVSAQGAENELPGQYRVGIVDRKAVFDSYEKQKIEYQRLEQEVQALQQQIETKADQIKRERDQYEAAREQMPEEQRRQTEERIGRDFRDYRFEYERLQSEIDSKHARLIEDLKEEINLAIAEVGELGNYHLILDGDLDPKSRTSVLYFSTTIDMTSQVIAYLNGKYTQQRR